MKENNQESIKKTGKKGRRFLIILGIIVILFILIFALPFFIFAFSMLFNMFLVYPEKPIEKHGEFPFELVYEYKGKKHVIKDTVICDFSGYSYAVETGNIRDWNEAYKNNSDYGVYYIDQENEPNLSIDIPSSCDYYMGFNDFTSEEILPHIYYSDDNSGTRYYEEKSVDVVQLKILEWKPSVPLKNNIR